MNNCYKVTNISSDGQSIFVFLQTRVDNNNDPIKYIINIINLERKWEEKPTQTTIQALEPSKLQQETQVSTVWF